MRMINARTWASLREVVSSIYIICGHVFFPNVLKRWRIHNFESCIWGSDPRAAHFLKLVKEEIKLLWFLKPVRILHGKIRSWHLTCEVCGYSHCRFDPLIHAAWGRAVDTNQNWKKSSINLIIHIDHWNPFGIDKHFWQVCVCFREEQNEGVSHAGSSSYFGLFVFDELPTDLPHWASAHHEASRPAERKIGNGGQGQRQGVALVTYA